MKKSFRIIKFKKNKPVLQVKGVSKSFDGRPILKKINLDLFPGEIVGLIGPNGSGKSTLYGAIIGQYKIDAGKCISYLTIEHRGVFEDGRSELYDWIYDELVFHHIIDNYKEDLGKWASIINENHSLNKDCFISDISN